jgi:hypothetical protein
VVQVKEASTDEFKDFFTEGSVWQVRIGSFGSHGYEANSSPYGLYLIRLSAAIGGGARPKGYYLYPAGISKLSPKMRSINIH